MPTDRRLDRTISSWLEAEAPGPLPDRVLRATFERTHRTRQQVGWRAVPGRLQMTRPILALGALAAVVAVAGLGLYVNRPGVGAGGTPPQTASLAPTATLAPTTTPTPAPTPALIPDQGDMQAGTYFTRPLPAPHDGLTLTFTVPEGWFGFGDATIFPADESVPGMAFQFIDVTSVNSDLCQWQGPDGDVSAGTTVDDLVAALVAQTAYEVSDPVDVSIAGYRGKRVDVVYPANLFEGMDSSAPDCDEGVVRLWSTSAHGEIGIYGQGPNERWQANILDVDGTRFVIVAQDDPGTSAADRAAGDAIVASMVIEP